MDSEQLGVWILFPKGDQKFQPTVLISPDEGSIRLVHKRVFGLAYANLNETFSAQA
ncbi:hypothetical protein J6590_050308 [Homalodisca vitripennis]|nr:hypothetical protein J6590_050308 [Homalodisca vitripennis]